MHTKKRLFVQILASVGLFIVAVALVLAAWLYWPGMTAGKQKIFQSFSLPVALVNFRPISMPSLVATYQIEENLQNSQFSGPPSATPQAALQQLIYEQQVLQTGQGLGVAVSQSEIDEFYDNLAAQNNNLDSILSANGMTENSFKQEFVKPQLYLTDLQIWYNSQPSLNQQVYNQAQDLLNKINSGYSMQTLAADYSQDTTGKLTGGDLGYIDPTSLLPELREPVIDLKEGQAAVIPGRDGLHIFRLEGKNGNLLHLRQIFLTGGDFQSWLNQKISNYKVIKLVKV